MRMYGEEGQAQESFSTPDRSTSDNMSTAETDGQLRAGSLISAISSSGNLCESCDLLAISPSTTPVYISHRLQNAACKRGRKMTYQLLYLVHDIFVRYLSTPFFMRNNAV